MILQPFLISFSFAWLLVAAVLLNGAHAVSLASIASYSKHVNHHRLADNPDDGTLARLNSDLHNHIDKQNLKSLHKQAMSVQWLPDERRLKAADKQVKFASQNLLRRLFGLVTHPLTT